MKPRFCITETRQMSDGSERRVDRAVIPLSHRKKAAFEYGRMIDSLKSSGLRGRVTVAVDGQFQRVTVDEGGRLIILEG